MRYRGPRTKKARRVGQALRDKDAKILTKRNYPPGMHGQGRRRISEYGTQLLEKQKAKWMYGITERQFRNYYQKASAKKGVTPQVLLELLEQRLDNVVYRLGFAQSRPQARQLVSHGFFTVNGKSVNIPSYQVSVGDTVAVVDKKKDTTYMQTAQAQLKEYEPQEWLEVHAKDLSGKVRTAPTHDNTNNTIRMQLITELYSR